MREIIFRGKRTDNHQWVEGFYIVDDKENPNPYIVNSGGKYRVAHKSVGQYTGLTDKNGKRIFEGDIVRVEYIGNNNGVYGVGEVVFQDCKFGLLWGHKKEVVCLTHFCNVEFEIIGNVYDNNPELTGGNE